MQPETWIEEPSIPLDSSHIITTRDDHVTYVPCLEASFLDEIINYGFDEGDTLQFLQWGVKSNKMDYDSLWEA